MGIGNQATSVWEADTMTSYKILFYGKKGQIIGQRVVACEGHWEACQWGWQHMPSKGDDFHVEELIFMDEREDRNRKDDEIVQEAFHVLRKRAGMVKVT
jgi:hypothetical protein